MRWIVRILGALLVTALVLVAGVFLLPGEKIAKVAVDQIRAATGREVTVEGGVELSWYPVLGVRTGPVMIANAAWSDKGPMVRAQGLSIGVETAPLFSGQVKVKALELISPKILLERARDGRGNWEIDGASGGSSPKLSLSLDRVEVADGGLRYIDHKSGSEQAFDKVDATLVVPDLNGTAKLSLVLHPAGAPVSVNGTIDGFSSFVQGNAVPVAAVAKAGGGTIDFSGRASATGDAEGRLVVDLPKTAGFLAALGAGGADLPKGLGQSVKAEGLIVVKDGTQVALRKLELTLDQNRLVGDIDLGLGGDVAEFKARLNAGALDLSALTAGESAPAGTGWSTARIDASALAALNGQARVTATSVDLGTVKTGATDLTLTIDRSRAVFNLNQVAAYGGAFTGEFVVNNRKGLSVGGKMNVAGVEVQDLLQDLAGVTRLSGKGDGAVSFLGSGPSVDAIMKSLSGDGRLKMGRGTINGFDLDRLMRTGDGTGGTTIFDDLGASFAMTGGDLQNDDLKLTLPGLEAGGKGRVGLGARDIDYLFTPVALQARGGKGLAIPVRIKGPWASPKIIPDLKAAIDLNLAEEKKALEQKVETKVKEKLKQELGVEVKEGQKIEDAVKEGVQQKLEDEVKKGLLKLLE
jgi:AsmA protein